MEKDLRMKRAGQTVYFAIAALIFLGFFYLGVTREFTTVLDVGFVAVLWVFVVIAMKTGLVKTAPGAGLPLSNLRVKFEAGRSCEDVPSRRRVGRGEGWGPLCDEQCRANPCAGDQGCRARRAGQRARAGRHHVGAPRSRAARLGSRATPGARRDRHASSAGENAAVHRVPEGAITRTVGRGIVATLLLTIYGN